MPVHKSYTLTFKPFKSVLVSVSQKYFLNINLIPTTDAIQEFASRSPFLNVNLP